MAETKIGNGGDENTCSGKRQGATFQTYANHLLIGMRRTPKNSMESALALKAVFKWADSFTVGWHAGEQ